MLSFWNLMMNRTKQNTARSGVLSMVLLLCLAGLSLHAGAADKKAGREHEAMRRAQQQLAQAQGQIATLEQENAKLTGNLGKSQAAAKAAEGQSASLQHEVKAGKQQQSSQAKELAQVKADLGTAAQQLADTRKNLDETSRALQQASADKNALQALKSRNEREIGACESKNLALYKLGRSLMERFENKSCGETLTQGDPFTGIKRVETENLLEEYRDKLDEQKLIKPPGG